MVLSRSVPQTSVTTLSGLSTIGPLSMSTVMASPDTVGPACTFRTIQSYVPEPVTLVTWHDTVASRSVVEARLPVPCQPVSAFPVSAM